MLRLALKMLMGSGAKYLALLLGVTFTAFLVTFAASFFCGMMTRGFALIAENSAADVWVMHPAVQCPEQTVNMPDGTLKRVRSVAGVGWADPMTIATTDIHFPNGRFQSVELHGVDDATLIGVPPLDRGAPPGDLRSPDAAVVADGGTEGKLQTPTLKPDQWAYGRPHLDAPSRPLDAGDEVRVNDARIKIAGRAAALPRFPARPLLYMTYSNALRILPVERERLTFVVVKAAPGVVPRDLAVRIEATTGLRARSSEDFKADTVRWYLENSEDVGDVEAMLTVALCVGLGVTGVMFFLFTQDNLRYYAMLKAMGADSRMLVAMLLAQAIVCALLGAGIGVGLCAIAGPITSHTHVPFRMMWFTPLVGTTTVVLVTLVAAVLSLRPVLKLEPAMVFRS